MARVVQRGGRLPDGRASRTGRVRRPISRASGTGPVIRMTHTTDAVRGARVVPMRGTNETGRSAPRLVDVIPMANEIDRRRPVRVIHMRDTNDRSRDGRSIARCASGPHRPTDPRHWPIAVPSADPGGPRRSRGTGGGLPRARGGLSCGGAAFVVLATRFATPVVLAERPLAHPDVLGRDLDQLVGGDRFDR
jgi:hypothetical protein